jgi:hypothetical protein
MQFAVLRYLHEKTKIPVPQVYGFSLAIGEDKLRPFIVEEWVSTRCRRTP